MNNILGENEVIEYGDLCCTTILNNILDLNSVASILLIIPNMKYRKATHGLTNCPSSNTVIKQSTPLPFFVMGVRVVALYTFLLKLVPVVDLP